MTPKKADVAAVLDALYVAKSGAGLRREDFKKAAEITALLGELSRLGRISSIVDAAAGKGYVGLVAAELLGIARVVAIEREVSRARAIEEARSRLCRTIELDLRVCDGSDPHACPQSPDVVVALHACGVAADHVIDGAMRKQAKWLLLVPCCRGRKTPFEPQANALADALGVARQAAVRRVFLASMVDAERIARLEASGYEVTASAFVPASVTGENLLLRARLVGEPKAMDRGREKLARLGRRPASESVT